MEAYLSACLRSESLASPCADRMDRQAHCWISTCRTTRAGAGARRWRVFRLLAIMTAGGNAFDERINKFNRSMNRGYKLSRWFTKEFGSTQCQAITQCDFSDTTGVSNYVEGQLNAKCKTIAGKVAEKVQTILG